MRVAVAKGEKIYQYENITEPNGSAFENLKNISYKIAIWNDVGLLITVKSVLRFSNLPKPRSRKRSGFHNLRPLNIGELKHAFH